MPTNEERRKVAARLRILASHLAADEELAYDMIGRFDIYGVMELADLIEPEERTCRNVADNYYGMGFVCSECTRAVPEDEYDHEVDKYCSCCGAKVVE